MTTTALDYPTVVAHEVGIYVARSDDATGARAISVARPNVPHGMGYGSRPEDGRENRGRALSLARSVWGSAVVLVGPALSSHYIGGTTKWTTYAVTPGQPFLAEPTIYASTSPQNDDPAPMVGTQTGTRYPTPFGADQNPHGEAAYHRPRPEFDRPRVHGLNPILVAARDSWDRGNDMWGQALAWLDGVENYAAGFGYADAADAESWGASYERITVWHLAEDTDEWDLPRATDAHVEHARRVFDKMADVARALGLNY